MKIYQQSGLESSFRLEICLKAENNWKMGYTLQKLFDPVRRNVSIEGQNTIRGKSGNRRKRSALMVKVVLGYLAMNVFKIV